MSYYQSPYGVPQLYGAPPMQNAPSAYASPYAAYPQQMQYAAAMQPYAQSPYAAAYAAQPAYMAQLSQLYQQQPYAQQSPYAQQPYASPQPYANPQSLPPAQSHQSAQLHHQHSAQAQQAAQSHPYYSAQQMQQPVAAPTQYPHQPMNTSGLDAVGLPVIAGDLSLQFPQTFMVEEKILSVSRDSFIVRDQQGNMRYKVEGSLSIHEHKTLKDVHGRVLLRMKEARLRMKDKITISNPENIPIITLQKTSAFQVGSKRVHGYLGTHLAGTPAIVITGNFGNTQFKIHNSHNVEIASVRRRKFSIKNITTGQDSYEVLVNHGSPALVCLLTVAIDEIYED